MKQQDFPILRYCEINLSHAQNVHLAFIFYEASATKQFASPDARQVFEARWLGNYLKYHAEHAFLAIAPDGLPAGYLVGAMVDPATDPLQADLGYFRDLAPHTRRFPAHLHVNLDASYRSQGLGARLVERFCVHAAGQGAPGVHVVTGKGMRNVGFYTRLGFAEVADVAWNGKPLVMLARALS